MNIILCNLHSTLLHTMPVLLYLLVYLLFIVDFTIFTLYHVAVTQKFIFCTPLKHVTVKS